MKIKMTKERIKHRRYETKYRKTHRKQRGEASNKLRKIRREFMARRWDNNFGVGG